MAEDTCRFSARYGADRPGSAGSDEALVLDANWRQALVTARSLGQAGIRVRLAETASECDPHFRVPAFGSRWSVSNTILPGFGDDPDAYARGVLQLIERRPTRVIIPSSDGSVAAVRPWREKYAQHGAALALAADEALEIANDKLRTLEIARWLNIPTPRTAEILHPDLTETAIDEVGLPAVIKPTCSWVRNGAHGTRVTSRAVLSVEEALRAVRSLHSLGSLAVAQQWVSGARESVSFLYSQGRIWAEFAQLAERTAPVLGGVSVVRQSIPMPPDLRASALALLETIDLEGYSEVEFRRDGSGRPFLMEINARLSGSVETAVRSGVDFPALLWMWAAGEPVPRVSGYRTGVRMRFLSGDVQWLLENLLVRHRPDSVPPLRALAAFLREFFRRDGYDYVDARDLRPAAISVRQDLGLARRRFVPSLRDHQRPQAQVS